MKLLHMSTNRSRQTELDCVNSGDKLDAKLFDEEQEASNAPAEEAPTADTFKINAKPLHRKSEVKFE